MRTKCQLRNAIPPARSGAGMLRGAAEHGACTRRMAAQAHAGGCDARAASKNTRVASSPVRSSASDNVIPLPAMRSCTVRCRGQLPPHARHHYICSRTRRLNLELRARRAPEAEAHLASSSAAVRPTAARSGDMRSVETRGIECVTPPAKGCQF